MKLTRPQIYGTALLLAASAWVLTGAPQTAPSEAPAPTTPAAASSQVSTTMVPTADSILQRFVEVTGGSKSYDSVKTEIASGSFGIAAAGVAGTIKIYSAVPNKSYAVVDIPNVGKIEEGSDGKIAWQNSVVQGARIKTGDEAAQAIRESAMDLHSNWRKYYKSADVDGIDTVDGKTCYKLTLKPLQGSPETVWFEKDSGFLVKQSAISDTPMGKVPADILFSDYRKQGDITLPFHIQQQVAGQQFDVKLEKFEINPDIPDSRFDLPAEIKALQK